MAQTLETKSVTPDSNAETGANRSVKAAPAVAMEAGRQGSHGEGAAAVQPSGPAAAEPRHRGDHAMTNAAAATGGDRTMFEDMAAEFDRFSRQMARTMEQGTVNLHEAMLQPADTAETLRDLQDAMTAMINGVMQSNLRLTLALLHMDGPSAMLEAQHRFIQDYGDALLHGGSTFIHLTRRTADRTLHPIQQRIDRLRRKGHDHPPVVSDVMSADVHVVTPEDTVQQATRLMRDDDTGVLPVGEGDRLVGIVTDRDVTLRVVAEGRDPQRTKVREVMSTEPSFVFDDVALEQAADDMQAREIRRLPVVNRSRRVVGMVSATDLARGGLSGRVREARSAAG